MSAADGRTKTVEPALASLVRSAMRAPLEMIAQRARGMLDDTAGPLRHEYLAYARNIDLAAGHLLRLIDDLVSIDGTGRTRTVRLAPVDLSAVADEVCALNELAAHDADVALQCRGEAFNVMADHGAVVQIACNLLTNAVRHAPRGSTVTVGLRANDGIGHLMVRDRGPGIPAADHVKIFDKFVQLKPNGEGSGLGLHIARSLAREMGGDVSVNSRPGEGAAFVLSLPLA